MRPRPDTEVYVVAKSSASLRKVRQVSWFVRRSRHSSEPQKHQHRLMYLKYRRNRKTMHGQNVPLGHQRHDQAPDRNGSTAASNSIRRVLGVMLGASLM